MSLIPLIAALIGTVVIALLLVEYYRQPLLAVGAVAVGIYVILWMGYAAFEEWRR